MPPITRPVPPRKPNHPTPLLRLEIRDLSSPGAQRFLDNVPVSSLLQSAVTHVLTLLYPSSSTWLPTRSVTLILESFQGVAYTHGIQLDNDHKEIHFSTDYIVGINPTTSDRIGEEIAGVVVHEMVHCWQRNGRGSCPGGLIEGIADWVRLKAGYAPPHWKQVAEGNWDQGYQVTAYFLEWIEENRGKGSVAKINEALRDAEYEEEGLWKGLFGKNVTVLWEEYVQSLKKDHKQDSQDSEAAAEKKSVNMAGDGANE